MTQLDQCHAVLTTIAETLELARLFLTGAMVGGGAAIGLIVLYAVTTWIRERRR